MLKNRFCLKDFPPLVPPFALGFQHFAQRGHKPGQAVHLGPVVLSGRFDYFEVSLGVAAYGYDWPAGKAGGRARPAAEIMQAAKDVGLMVQWDQNRQTPFLKYNAAGGGPREVWFENGEAAAMKMQLAKKYRLAGISVWRLGCEDPDFWREINQR